MKKAILIIVSVLSACVGNAHAGNRYVPIQYPNIRSAINACNNGDVVLVQGGAPRSPYSGPGNWDLDFQGKAIKVRSFNGPENCTIVGSSGHRAFHFQNGEGPDSVVEGFTITGGYMQNDNGGAILCEAGTSPTIKDCIIINNEVTGQLVGGYGGAIACMDTASPTIIGCTIESNRAAYGGGIGAYCSSGQGGSLTITDCPSIADNQAGRGGGVYCSSDTTAVNVLTITNSVISGNSARSDNSNSLDDYAYGGGVYASNCQVGIVDSTVSYNRIFSADRESYGVGIYCYDSSLNLENSVLKDNMAEFIPSSWDCFGGGLHFEFAQGPALAIDNCTIIGNYATKGGGVYCQSNGSVLEPEIVNSLIASNMVDGLGGGIYFRNLVDGLIANSKIVGNNSVSYGGGIELDIQCSPTIVNCLLAGNSVLYGTGGGAIDCYGSSPMIVNCTIVSNSANIVGGLGGGVHCESPTPAPPPPLLPIPANPTIINCLFADNDNHAIYESNAGADPNVSYCHFYNNEPNDYGDYYDFDQDETFTGAANLDGIADGFVTNSSDGDPSFAMYDPDRIVTGAWHIDPVYDPVTNRTALTDFAGSFTPGALVNRLVNPNTWQKRQVLIAANTATTIEVVGNVALSLGGYVESSDPYIISDYRLQIVSVCSDAGDSTTVSADTADLDDDSDTTEKVPYDLDGLPRIIEDPWHVNTGNGPGAIVDIGAYEIQVPSRIVVDKAATGANNGRTWDDALNYLQDAIEIADASNGGINQIQVAQGTYKPDEGVNQTAGNRSASFQLIDGVKIRGGHVGIVSADPNTRDIRQYPTILSGDLNDNDDTVGNSDNSYNVVTGSGNSPSALLEGFVITAGNANNNTGGGGMYNSSSSPTVISCKFVNNSTNGGGGGIANQNGSNPTIESCWFGNNQALVGGAITNFDTSSPSFVNCTFTDNTAISSGAVVFNQPLGSPLLTNCILWGNTDGGSIPELTQIYGGMTVVSYSCVQDDDPNGANVYHGIGNIDGDPLFADADGTNDDDVHLLAASPCIDSGDNSAISAGFGDCDGYIRIASAAVDMGAFEWRPPADYNRNGVVDSDDLAFFASYWLYTGCNDSGGNESDWCFGTDLTTSGEVDYIDFADISAMWQ